MTAISDATGRIAIRRRVGRRRRILLVVLAVLLLTVVGTAGWLFGFSDVFATRTVQIGGVKLLTAEEVERVADVPLGTPLLRVDPAAVADRVSGLPPVARVSVSRRWPNTVVIEVIERKGQFAIETPGGYLVADADGVIFQSVTELPKALMKAVVPTGDPRLVRDLGTVLRALPGPLRGEVVEVRANTADTITLFLRKGTEIIWGSAEGSDLKATVIVEVMKQPGKVYDVSAPSHPTVR